MNQKSETENKFKISSKQMAISYMKSNRNLVKRDHDLRFWVAVILFLFSQSSFKKVAVVNYLFQFLKLLFLE
jgi:hypothetical protein